MLPKVNNFSSSSVQDLPRITERRPTETGRGGKASDAGVKVCVFGATGFLGRYVCSGLGAFCANTTIHCWDMLISHEACFIFV